MQHANALYEFQFLGSNGRPTRLTLPVPTDELVAYFAERLECICPAVLVDEAKTKWIWAFSRKPTPRELGIFYESLQHLLGMEETLHDALLKTVQLISNFRLKHAILCIVADLKVGQGAEVAFPQHPDVFDATVCGQIAAGADSNSLAQTFAELAAFNERREQLRAKTIVAMVYPAGVLIFVYMMVAGILYFLVPKFETSLRAMNASLPSFTRVTLDAGHFCHAFPFVIGILPAVIFLTWVARDYVGPALIAVFRHAPFFGGFYMHAQLATTVTTLASLVSKGILMPAATTLVAGATGDAKVRAAYLKARASMEQGDSASRAYAPIFRLFGKRAIYLEAAIEIGEKSSLAKTLPSAASKYRDDFSRLSDVAAAVMQPLVIAFAGVIVGGIVGALWYPIITASNAV